MAETTTTEGRGATLWVLGSAGWMPKAGQETSCLLLEAQGQLIMLDAGTGVANLGLAAKALQRHDRLSILLSHYHLDHRGVCGGPAAGCLVVLGRAWIRSRGALPRLRRKRLLRG